MLGLSLEPTLTVGNILFALLTAVVGAFVYFRSTSATVWRENAAAEKAERERLATIAEERERGIGRLADRVKELEGIISELGGIKIMDAVTEQAKVAGERYTRAMAVLGDTMASHERRAQDRHEKTIAALEAMTERLNDNRRTP